ncbi:MAG TPA: hypothetical protein VNJ54_21170 [Plantibacter sp.]|uniref:hypothetical protein n=1 Tax=unclassified Plantibacter TaxID=2624265 RepID=UPI002C28F5B2|nr:hypothetical protein [Plantibacter sp.]
MKHLHYAGQVFAISDQLADTLADAITDFVRVGRSALWPVAGYQDEREVVAKVLCGPGIPFLIAPTWLPDDREPPKHDADSIAFIDGDHHALEAELLDDDA